MNGPVLLYLAMPYLVMLFSLVLPFFCGKAGWHVLLVFFPAGLCLLLSPVYPGYAGEGLLCMLIALVSCTAGNEYAKRQHGDHETEKRSKCAKNQKRR